MKPSWYGEIWTGRITGWLGASLAVMSRVFDVHRIRNPKRVASPSIAGHHYGFVCISHLWLDLGRDGFLVVEGNEDVDLVVCHNTTEIQYKRGNGTFGSGNNLVYGSLGHFLEGWSEHHSDQSEFHGVLQTTGHFSEKRESRIGRWIRENEMPDDIDEFQRDLLRLLENKAQIGASLLREIEPQSDFRHFVNSISWQTSMPGINEEAERLLRRLGDLVPDLSADLAARVVTDAVAAAARSDDAKNRRLTKSSLWETLNDATLDSLEAANVKKHLLQGAMGCYRSDSLCAACLLLANTDHMQQLALHASSWSDPDDADLASRVGGAADFACYVAVCSNGKEMKSARKAVLRQVRYIYPDIPLAGQDNAPFASRIAIEVARRCTEFEAERQMTRKIAPFIAKIRWLRLSNGSVKTARDLLVSKNAS